MARDLDEQTEEAFTPSTKATEAVRSESDRTRESDRYRGSERSQESKENDYSERRSASGFGTGMYESPGYDRVTGMDELTGEPVRSSKAGPDYTVREEELTNLGDAKELLREWNEEGRPLPSKEQLADVTKGIPQALYDPFQRMARNTGSMGDVAEVAGSLAGVGTVTAPTRSADTLGILAGSKARTAPVQNLDGGVKAGVRTTVDSPETVGLRNTQESWEEKGWEVDPNTGSPMWEIDPSNFSINDGVRQLTSDELIETNLKLRDVVNFPELYEAYPQLENLPVSFSSDKRMATIHHRPGNHEPVMLTISADAVNNGYQLPDGTRIPFEELIYHELQHGVDGIEGRLDPSFKETFEVMPEVIQLTKDYMTIGRLYDKSLADGQITADGHRMLIDDLERTYDQKRQTIYELDPEEVRANAAASRLYLSKGQREATSPMESFSEISGGKYAGGGVVEKDQTREALGSDMSMDSWSDRTDDPYRDNTTAMAEQHNARTDYYRPDDPYGDEGYRAGQAEVGDKTKDEHFSNSDIIGSEAPYGYMTDAKNPWTNTSHLTDRRLGGKSQLEEMYDTLMDLSDKPEKDLTIPEARQLDAYREFFRQRMGMAEGGAVERDPVSGNEVPPGSEPENVRDDVPALLSEGEFVIPANVVNYYGISKFDKMIDDAEAKLEELDAKGRVGGEPVKMAEGGTVSGFDSRSEGYSEDYWRDQADSKRWNADDWTIVGASYFDSNTASQVAEETGIPEEELYWVYEQQQRDEAGDPGDSFESTRDNYWTMDRGKFQQMANSKFNIGGKLSELFGNGRVGGLMAASRVAKLKAAAAIARERGFEQEAAALEAKAGGLSTDVGTQAVNENKWGGAGFLGKILNGVADKLLQPARAESVYNRHSAAAGKPTVPDPDNPYTEEGSDRPPSAGGRSALGERILGPLTKRGLRTERDGTVADSSEVTFGQEGGRAASGEPSGEAGIAVATSGDDIPNGTGFSRTGGFSGRYPVIRSSPADIDAIREAGLEPNYELRTNPDNPSETIYALEINPNTYNLLDSMSDQLDPREWLGVQTLMNEHMARGYGELADKYTESPVETKGTTPSSSLEYNEDPRRGAEGWYKSGELPELMPNAPQVQGPSTRRATPTGDTQPNVGVVETKPFSGTSGVGVDGLTSRTRETIRPPSTAGTSRLVTPSSPDTTPYTDDRVRPSLTPAGLVEQRASLVGETSTDTFVDDLIASVANLGVELGSRVREAKSVFADKTNEMRTAVEERRDNKVVPESDFEVQVRDALGGGEDSNRSGVTGGMTSREDSDGNFGTGATSGEDNHTTSVSRDTGGNQTTRERAQTRTGQTTPSGGAGSKATNSQGNEENRGNTSNSSLGGMALNKGGLVAYKKGGFVTRRK